MGFDPGSVSFGIGILKKEANRVMYLHSEEIKLKEKDFYAKMRHLWERLETLYSSFPIDEAAMEEGFLGKNVKAMNVLAKVRGVVLGSLVQRRIGVGFYSPRQIKLALTGSGSAMKSQVGKMLKILLHVDEKELGGDESDALAAAYCHIMKLK
jgi:crossover junction endodeoxyribonuclease RuvC